MWKDKESIRLRLSREQQEQIRKKIGQAEDALELSIMELEERIAPSVRRGG